MLARGILLIWLLLGVFGPWLADAPNHIRLEQILRPPTLDMPLGTDDLGRDVLDRLLVGARVSLLVAVAAVGISGMIGIALGLLAGYLGGWTDRVVTRGIDVFLAFPGMLLAIALAAMSGPGLNNVIIALSAMGWVGYARLVRVQTQGLSRQEHVVAAHALGSGHLTIVRRHILPLLMAPIWVEISYGLAGTVIAEAGLSFLGLGIQPPDASWGGMIRDGVRYLLVAPHLVLAPGVALCLVVLAVNLLGDELRDRLDVTARSRR